jgi:hypothetical protein
MLNSDEAHTLDSDFWRLVHLALVPNRRPPSYETAGVMVPWEYPLKTKLDLHRLGTFTR